MRTQVTQRGSSLPETAIVMTVLLALLFGIIDFGRATYTYAFVGQLARQGARWAIVRGSSCSQLDHCNASPADIQNYLQTLSQGATSANGITVKQATWSNCPPGFSGHAPGCTVSITVQYPFSFLLPFMPGGSLATINMVSSSQMVISQ